jgi:hypothetical protein
VALSEALAGLASVMRRLDARWCLLGAQAAVVHGRPRMTADIDVTVELGGRSVTTMLEALAGSGFASAFAFDDAFVAATRVVPVVHQASGMPVDIMLAGPGLEELFIGAAELTTIAGVEVPVIRAEHLVVMKILAGRPRDLEDVEGIVAAKSERLGRGEVEQLLEMLEAALGQSDLLPRWHAIASRGRRPRNPR